MDIEWEALVDIWITVIASGGQIVKGPGEFLVSDLTVLVIVKQLEGFGQLLLIAIVANFATALDVL